MSEIEAQPTLLTDFDVPAVARDERLPWYRHRGWKIASRVLTVVVAIFALYWFFALRPVVLGGPASYVMVSGVSMEPTYHDGDMVILTKSENYKDGDVIAYRVPAGEFGEGNIIIHRVIGRDERGYVTQGDNRTGKDSWRPNEGDILGRTKVHLPGLGRHLETLRSPLILAGVAGVFAIYFVLTFEGPKRGIRKR
jgi:signal peptidase I